MDPFLEETFSAALHELLANDVALVNAGVNERTLCGRLAMYLERAKAKRGLAGYYADVEYNRNVGRVKTILAGRERVVRVNCDIILHSRGESAARDNLIAIEMKKATRRWDTKQKDRERLRALTATSYDGVWSYDGLHMPEHVCGYKLGYFMELIEPMRAFVIEKFVEGEIVDRTQANFRNPR